MSEILLTATKICTKCNQSKPLDQFGWIKAKNIPVSRCKICHNLEARKNYRSNIQYYKEYGRVKNLDPARKRKVANSHLLKKYGITIEQKESMFSAQNGKCAICPHLFKDLSDAHVDHEHATGKLRDLLCHSCNVSIGLVKEDKTRLDSMRFYLARHDDNYTDLSKFAQYLKERENVDLLETAEGYATYIINGDECYIKDIFVGISYRKTGVASKIADKITAKAKEKGCKFLTGSVCPTTNNSTASIEVLLRYGMSLHSAQPNLIIFKKDIV